MMNAAWIEAKNMTYMYSMLRPLTHVVVQKHYLFTAKNNNLHTNSNHVSSWIFFHLRVGVTIR
jgi:hypothetical protein